VQFKDQAGRKMAGLIAGWTALFVFLWTALTMRGSFLPLDAAVRSWVAAVRTPVGMQVNLIISQIGSQYGAPIVVAILGLVMVRRHAARWAGHFVVMVLSSTVWQMVLKQLLGRPRPESPLAPYWPGSAYPSGHALTAICLALGLLFYFRNFTAAPQMATGTAAGPPLGRLPADVVRSARGRLGLLRLPDVRGAGAVRAMLLIWPLAMGASRIYLDVHWATDVVAGYAVGLLHFMLWYHFFGWRLGPARQTSS
jgi:membrane-associated phospholipid phosphatase